MLGSDFPKINARYIEAGRRPFLCEYRHTADRPHGVAPTFSAEHADGVLMSARYHRFRDGSDLRLLEEPAR
jgi:hypothetical protein